MAQATRNSNRKGSSGGRSPSAGKRRGATGGKSGGRSEQAKGAARSAATHAPGPAGRVGDALVARQAAIAGTKAAGRAAAAVASQGKTPLVLGGAALAGIAGRTVIKNRGRSPRSGGRLADALRPLRGAELDLEAVASAARRLSDFSARVADMATAAQELGKHSASGRRRD